MSRRGRSRPVPRRLAMIVALASSPGLPLVGSSYVLSVATLALYLAYAGQAWNVMMGFAGQLSLGHSLYVGLGAYAAAGCSTIRRRALGRRVAGDRAVRRGGGVRRLARLPSAASRASICRCSPSRSPSSRASPSTTSTGWAARAGSFLQGRRSAIASTCSTFRGPPAMYYYVDAGADRGRPRGCAPGCCAAAPATTGAPSARTRTPRRRSASTPSAGSCSPSSSARR